MDKNVNIQRVEGGFIVTTDVSIQVTPSLQKAFKIAREYVSSENEEQTETE